MNDASDGDLRAYRQNIWKFYTFRWLVNFQLFLPIWVIYLTDERGLSLTELTFLDTAFWLLIVVMEVPTGAIADRYGRKVSLSYGALCNAVAIAIFGIAGDYTMLLISYMAWGVAWTLFSGADAAFFYDSLRAIGREHEYQKLFGRCWAIQNTGVLAGVLLGAPIAAWTSLPVPILINAGIMFAAWLVALSFKEPPRLSEHEHQLGYIEGARQAVKIVWSNPSLRYLMMLAAYVVAVAMCVGILLQPFLSSHGVNVGNFGWFSVPGIVLGMLAALFAYRVTARVGINKVIIALPLMTLFASSALSMWDSIYAFIFYPINGMVWSLSFPVVSDYINLRIPGGQRATILSIYQLMYSLVLAPVEPLLGFIADESGLQAAYRTAAILVAVGAAPLLALWLRAVRNEPARAPVALPEAAAGGS